MFSVKEGIRNGNTFGRGKRMLFCPKERQTKRRNKGEILNTKRILKYLYKRNIWKENLMCGHPD